MNYIPSKAEATAKYIKRDTISTIVVTNGLDITAGSSLSFFAITGSIHPTSFAQTIVMSSVRQTARAIGTVLPSINTNFKKLQTDNVMPHNKDTRNSFHKMIGRSRKETSPKEIPRITVTDAWLPALPAVFISIGINAAKATCA